ncbi:carboxymuconolactone decarboxylase family protein [Mucilaginibacter sp.]|jgi:alkylhydroperoxidase family enzyme|uniref:carboxymuconolactone decarboxylase family protein n=1 Tax=Mucilaginibacter sp. TaxID=1882438 RepID=UPI00356532EC
MRLPPIKPEQLTAEQRPLYDSISKGIENHLQGFISKLSDGALVGPFNPMIHFPQFGAALWNYNMVMAANSTLPKAVREVAILVVGAKFTSRYEIYAHEKVGLLVGLSENKIATISSGQRPAELSEEEGLGFDVAAVLTKGAQLPDSLYQLAKNKFGEHGLTELVHLIGVYCLVSVLLNAYDVAVPEVD